MSLQEGEGEGTPRPGDGARCISILEDGLGTLFTIRYYWLLKL